MKNSSQRSYTRGKFRLQCFLVSIFLLVINLAEAQSYTEDFATTPALVANPVYPSSIQKAVVTAGGDIYEVTNSGNGGWEYKTAGGLGNSASLLYSLTATSGSTVIIKRQDGTRFQFYGAWLKYTNFGAYAAPWLTVVYNGSETADQVFTNNTTVLLSKNVNVISVTLQFTGLHNLNLDHIVVGPEIPITPFLPSTEPVTDFSNNSATVGGSVTDDGGAEVTESGIVYGTSPQPTVTDNKVPLSSGMSSFYGVLAGLAGDVTYYVRSFATNSAGTSYGNEESFTTFGTFTMAGSHNFNSAWIGTYYQVQPFTKYVEGWDVTGDGSGFGLISISKLTGPDAGEGIGSLSVSQDVNSESLTYISLKPHSGSLFNLQNFLFRYSVQSPGTSFGVITVTGYKNGLAVPGALQTLLNISPSGTAPGYNSFTALANTFNDIDEFRLTASGSTNGAMLKSFDIDVITANVSVLPITYTSVKAYQKNSGIQVEWKVAAESDINHYEIEKSSNGQQFIKAFSVLPKANNYSTAGYNWLDLKITRGKNYYRIKSVFNTGETSYSQVMNVMIGGGNESITVNPNPVSGNSFNLQFTNQPKGKYRIQLFSISSRQVFNETIEHAGGSSTQTIDARSIFSKGSYFLRVTGPSKIYTQQLTRY